MKIVICGSMTHYPKMVEVKAELEELGHKVVLPNPGKDHHLRAIKNNNYVDTYRLKKRYDYIRGHYKHILKADCILITNWSKNGIKNYIGGNAFLEMGFAHILNKPIFLLNDVPNIKYYYHEMKGMENTVLNGDLKKLGT